MPSQSKEDQGRFFYLSNLPCLIGLHGFLFVPVGAFLILRFRSPFLPPAGVFGTARRVGT